MLIRWLMTIHQWHCLIGQHPRALGKVFILHSLCPRSTLMCPSEQRGSIPATFCLFFTFSSSSVRLAPSMLSCGWNILTPWPALFHLVPADEGNDRRHNKTPFPTVTWSFFSWVSCLQMNVKIQKSLFFTGMCSPLNTVQAHKCELSNCFLLLQSFFFFHFKGHLLLFAIIFILFFSVKLRIRSLQIWVVWKGSKQLISCCSTNSLEKCVLVLTGLRS